MGATLTAAGTAKIRSEHNEKNPCNSRILWQHLTAKNPKRFSQRNTKKKSVLILFNVGQKNNHGVTEKKICVICVICC